jgi:dUTP pyrophosphatase
VKEGDRIAQLILEKIHTPDVIEVEVRHLRSRIFLGAHVVQDLDDTERGTQGFGSTGGHAQL